MRRPPARIGEPRTGLVLTALGLAAVALAARPLRRIGRRPPPRPSARAASTARIGTSLLATSVLLDSGLEHFRGEYHRPAMFAAPAMGALTLSAALAPPGRGRTRRNAVYALGLLLGIVGNGFHLRQIARRPGGFNWEGLFYAAPAGAPGALSLAGASGLLADAARRGRVEPMTARLAADAMAAGLLFTSAEIALLHFRGAFHEPAMYAPLILPPAAAVALSAAAHRPAATRSATARSLLRATVALGAVGTAFHLRGVARQMGGWRNWTQNIQAGPPIPAPPGLSGAALAGLAALDLLEASR